jgi:trk system potassium uptake protein TrkA
MNIRRVLIIGCGRFGTAMARELWQHGSELIVVDRNERMLDDLKSYSDAAFIADCTDLAALESAGAREVDVAVVGLGDAFEAAVLTVAALKKWGVAEIVARATTRERAEVLEAVGATRVHEIESEMGQRAALEIITPVAPDLLDFANQFRVVPWAATGKLVGEQLKDCGLREAYGINVLGIRPKGDTGKKLLQARPDYVIVDGDVLLLVGEEDEVARFVKQLG